MLRRLVLAVLAILVCVATATAQTQPTEPLLPFQGPDGPGPERLGLNSFGRPLLLPAIHAEQLPIPPLDDLTLPPTGPPRIYITFRYYGCRPWFIHPYTGATLSATDLVRSVQTTNPEWQEVAKGRPLEELLKVDPDLGEPLISIVDEGLVDENNPAAMQEWQDEQMVEMENAEKVGVRLADQAIRPIVHAPFYGLYCLRVRLCIPISTATVAGAVYRYWVRFPFKLHQPYCWSRWWWHCWYRDPFTGALRIRPWRPLCVPHAFWTRSGPDWVWTVSNANRYRYWCLYGLRYYFTTFGSPLAVNRVPLVGDLHLAPTDLTTGFLRPWPYPTVRYWPFGPYSTRWYWFRCVPWFTYRYLPPVLQAAVAIPKDEFGAGFLPAPDPGPGDDPFPPDPPRLVEGEPFAKGGDSFFDINFDIAGACTVRPSQEPLGDSDGDGATERADMPRPLLDEQAILDNPDLEDQDVTPTPK